MKNTAADVSLFDLAVVTPLCWLEQRSCWFSDRPIQCKLAAAPQHFLNLFPLPHGQGALRPTLGCIVLAT